MIFDGFNHAEIQTSGAVIPVVHGGMGPPLLLLHGVRDQCHRKVAARYALFRRGDSGAGCDGTEALLSCDGVTVRRAMVRPTVRKCDGALAGAMVRTVAPSDAPSHRSHFSHVSHLTNGYSSLSSAMAM